MNRVFIAALVLLLAACGGKDTMASKSAAAYREAQTKGTPVEGGDAHGHDHGSVPADPATPTDHAAHAAATATASALDHSAMEHGSATTDHSAHGAAVQRDESAHAGHAAAEPSDPHAAHRATPAEPSDPHAGHRAPTPTGVTARDTSAEVSAGADPSAGEDALLRLDAFDAPSPVSVREAAKASGGVGDHESHVYTCPMHPEVTSATPGTCPKCGMTLVEKDSSK
ncbi:MAG: heavy metal-binding domain-containing protein [Thermoanaerobaculia bacterium]